MERFFCVEKYLGVIGVHLFAFIVVVDHALVLDFEKVGYLLRGHVALIRLGDFTVGSIEKGN